MKKLNVSFAPRTKLLDTAIASIQNRMNQFKISCDDTFYKEEYNVDYNISGKTWIRLPSETDEFVFNVGNYKVDPRVDKTGSADFVLHYDNVSRKIKGIFILTNEEA